MNVFLACTLWRFGQLYPSTPPHSLASRTHSAPPIVALAASGTVLPHCRPLSTFYTSGLIAPLLPDNCNPNLWHRCIMSSCSPPAPPPPPPSSPSATDSKLDRHESNLGRSHASHRRVCQLILASSQASGVSCYCI
jgi:hypothetical protein